MAPRVPTSADFASLPASLTVALHFPSPPESTTTFLILFHGLGDSEVPFATFARKLALPGVLAISVRGTSPLPPSILPRPGYHWGDDILMDETGALEPDPGFSRACTAVMDSLIKDILMDKCGWDTEDVILFGFGQGAALALGMPLASGVTLKGVVALGAGVPPSMCGGGDKNQTPVLLVQSEEGAEVKKRFGLVEVVRWRRGGDEVRMPRDSEEMYPIMKFFADRLRPDCL